MRKRDCAGLAGDPVVFVDHARDAEGAVLAAALQNDAACRLVCERLEGRCFAGRRERLVYTAIRELLEATGSPPDAATVLLHLQRTGRCDEATRDYILALGDAHVVATHVAYAVERVRELDLRRRARLAGLRLAEAALGPAVGFGRAAAEAAAVVGEVLGEVRPIASEGRCSWRSKRPSPVGTS